MTTPTTETGHPSAKETDPVRMGWMHGCPPPPERMVRFADGNMLAFPQNRWSLSNMGQLVPLKTIGRGTAGVAALPRHDRSDLDAVRFTPIGSATAMDWAEAFDANYTDGIVVLHRGRIVHERYGGALAAHKLHLAFSMTKSFVGLLAAAMVHDGSLNPQALVGHYVPELKGSAFGDANIRQLLDMTTALQYSETYTDPQAEIWQHARAGLLLPQPVGYSGPQGFREYLRTVGKQGQHGQGFMYKTVNTDALAWVLHRVTGQSLGALIEERIWSRLGAEHDAAITVDGEGTEFAGGGINTCLRDLARFGEMIRLGGQAFAGAVVPSAVVERIREGASTQDFKMGGYATLPGWSYRDMWWISHNAHGAFMARGVHGQAVYIDPLAEMVIARYASHHIAGNMGIDPQSLPAYHALALHLLRNP